MAAPFNDKVSQLCSDSLEFKTKQGYLTWFKQASLQATQEKRDLFRPVSDQIDNLTFFDFLAQVSYPLDDWSQRQVFFFVFQPSGPDSSVPSSEDSRGSPPPPPHVHKLPSPPPPSLSESTHVRDELTSMSHPFMTLGNVLT